MKFLKYLLVFIFLLFASGCNNINSYIQSSKSTNEPTAPSGAVQSTNIVKFSPSEWSDEPIISYSEEDGEILYQEGIAADRFWNSGELSQDVKPSKNKPVVPNKDIAVAIATIILKTQKNVDWDTTNMIAKGVFFDTKEKLWMVRFSEPPIDGLAQGELTIVIRKDNAQVVAIWAEAG